MDSFDEGEIDHDVFEKFDPSVMDPFDFQDVHPGGDGRINFD